VRASIGILVIAVGITGCYMSSNAYPNIAPQAWGDVRPKSQKASGVMASKWVRRKSTADNLVDRGGEVLPATTTYAVWWGDRSRFPYDAVAGMEAFLTGLDGSRYLAVANQYVGKQARAPFAGHIFDGSAAPTTSPSTDTIVGKVCDLLSTTGVTPSPTALYLVFTDTFPPEDMFCAWHDAGRCPNGTPIHVAYLPNGGLVDFCDPGNQFACNNLSRGTRILANVTAHEILEAITDPNGDGWVDRDGEEIADKCAWTFDSCSTLGQVSWQIQKEWSNAAGGCVQEQATGYAAR